jgi:hypothetical protein
MTLELIRNNPGALPERPLAAIACGPSRPWLRGLLRVSVFLLSSLDSRDHGEFVDHGHAPAITISSIARAMPSIRVVERARTRLSKLRKNSTSLTPSAFARSAASRM